MRVLTKIAGTVVLSAVLFSSLSCESSLAMLSDSDRDSLYTLTVSVGNQSLENGASVDPGDKLLLEVTPLAASKDQADTVEVSVASGKSIARIASMAVNASQFASDPQGSVGVAASSSKALVSVKSISSVSGKLPEIEMPEHIPPGYSTLSVKLLKAGSVVFEKRVSVFVMDGDLKVDYCTVYPETIEPGRVALFLAKVTASETAQPYLVVRQGVMTVATVQAKDGEAQFYWTAPGREGAYPFEIDLYPNLPPDGKAYDFRAPVRFPMNVTVAMKNEPVDEFASTEGFLSMFRFEGDYSDAIEPLRSVVLFPKQEIPVAGFAGSEYGYYFGQSKTMSVGEFPLPLAEGSLSPFSLMMRIAVPTPGPSDILSLSDASGSLALRLALDPGGSLMVSSSKEAGGEPLWTATGAKLDASFRSVHANFFPREGALDVLWLVDGQETGLTTVAFKSKAVSPSWKFALGGEGTRFLVGKLGWYANRNEDGLAFPYAQSYSDRARKDHGANVAVAEGFDSTYVPNAFRVRGGHLVARGSLALEADSVAEVDIRIPKTRALSLEYGWNGTKTEFRSSDKLAFSFAYDDDSGRFRMRDGEGNVLVSYPPGKSPNNLRIERTASGYVVECLDVKVNVPFSSLDTEVLTACFPTGTSQAQLSHFLAVKTEESLSASASKAGKSASRFSILPLREI